MWSPASSPSSAWLDPMNSRRLTQASPLPSPQPLPAPTPRVSTALSLYFHHGASGSIAVHRCEDEHALPYVKDRPKDLSLTPSGCVSFGHYWVLDLCLVGSQKNTPEEYSVYRLPSFHPSFLPSFLSFFLPSFHRFLVPSGLGVRKTGFKSKLHHLLAV